MLHSKPYSYETSRAHPDCSQSKCLITVVSTWHLHGKALGLRLQAISWASSHPSPPNRNQLSLAARAQAGEHWGWISAAITDHGELDFCPQTQLPLCPSHFRQQESWPAGMGWEQAWEPSFSRIKQLLLASSQRKQQTGEKPIKCQSLDCSSLCEVRNVCLDLLLHLLQAKKGATDMPTWQLFLAIHQWKQPADVNPSKIVLRVSTWWTTQERIFKLTLQITTFSDTDGLLLWVFSLVN